MATEHSKAPRWSLMEIYPLRCLLTSPFGALAKPRRRSVRPVTAGSQLSGFTTSRPHYPIRPPPTH